MENLTMEKLHLEISDINVWWSGEVLSDSKNMPIKRKGFYLCKKSIENKELDRDVVLIGPRRVGKTVILHQLIAYLLYDKKINPKQIVMLDLDDPLFRFTDLKSILNLILQINDLVMPIYLFLDEIQAAEAWDKTLKFFYDHHRGKIKKIVATGSSAAELIKGSQESGIGRWEEIDISTVSFHEYFENFINILDGENITREFEPLGEKLNSIEEIFNLRLSEAAEKSLLKFNDALYDYSIFGGFPELIPIKSEKDAQSVIRRDILDRTLNRDMVQIYNIRQPKEIEKLYFYICSNAGSETALTKLANILSVDNNTIKRYISQLKESRLIHNIPKWSKKQIPRGHEKIYPIDASIRNALLAKSKKDLISNPIDFGYVAELLAVTHTSRWAKYHSYSLQHYREQKKEIDIIVKEGNEVYPIEVKFQENIEIRDVLKNFDAFYEKNRFEKAFIINKGPDINGKIEIQKRKYELYVYPLWFYLTIISV